MSPFGLIGHDERGSIPMALLAVIVVGTVTAAIFASTIAEGRATRFDQNYVTTSHVAEAGINEAAFRLNNRLLTASTAAPVTGEENGVDYQWTATQCSGPTVPAVCAAVGVTTPADDTWVVDAVGGGDEVSGPNSVERTLRAIIVEEPLFGLAAFADHSIEFRGGNTADSYHSVNATRCSLGGVPRPDCFGMVGSNGNIVYVGTGGSSSTYADRTLVFDYLANPDSATNERCDANGNGPYCDATTLYPAYGNLAYRVNIDPPKEFSSAMQDVEAVMDGCSSFPDIVIPENSGRVELPYDGDQDVCLNSITVGKNSHLVLRPSVTPDMPLRLYLTGGLALLGQGTGNGGQINIENCSGGGADLPCTGRLYIFSTVEDPVNASGGTQPPVTLNNNTKIAAAVFAPRATCGGASNAQAEIYGSMICRAIGNVGGWAFHYDEALRDGARSGRFLVTRMDEIASP